MIAFDAQLHRSHNESIHSSDRFANYTSILQKSLVVRTSTFDGGPARCE